jgi:hypothetical protein
MGYLISGHGKCMSIQSHSGHALGSRIKTLTGHRYLSALCFLLILETLQWLTFRPRSANACCKYSVPQTGCETEQDRVPFERER